MGILRHRKTGAGMETKVIAVTPNEAAAWLANNGQNRRLRPRLVEKYANDMKAGRWSLTHQGLAFYDDGTLADGQHRLSAVVASGTCVEFAVTAGLPRAAGSAVDQHAQRQMHDALRIGGAASWIDKDAVAVIRFLCSGMGSGNRQLSAGAIEAFAETHERSLRFALGIVGTKKRNLTQAGIVACYVTAHLAGEPEFKLMRFAEIMHSGEIAGAHENAALRLREYLLFARACWLGASRLETARRAQRAIQSFCRGQALAKLFAPDKLIYEAPANAA